MKGLTWYFYVCTCMTIQCSSIHHRLCFKNHWNLFSESCGKKMFSIFFHIFGIVYYIKVYSGKDDLSNISNIYMPMHRPHFYLFVEKSFQRLPLTVKTMPHDKLNPSGHQPSQEQINLDFQGLSLSFFMRKMLPGTSQDTMRGHGSFMAKMGPGHASIVL